MKIWRVQITVPGKSTETRDIEADTSWAANKVALDAGLVPDGDYNISEVKS